MIKWFIWQFKPCEAVKNPSAIGLFGYPPDTVPVFKIGSLDGGGYIYSLDSNVTNDDETEIESYFKTSPLFWEPGNIHFFTASRLRVNGTGTLLCTIDGEDDILPASLPSINLSITDFRFSVRSFISGMDGVNTVFTL